jgi:peptidoglycan/LPS O-acetylase OafA/YrhL
MMESVHMDRRTLGQPLSYTQYRDVSYFPSLDGIRAISVLLVITVHMEFVDLQWLSGTTGVTAFFILSGYLITTLALREEWSRGRLCLSAFYIRRSFRILPAYYSVLAIYAILILLLPIPATEQRRAAFLTALPYYLGYMNEFGVRAAFWQSPFSQSWSLGIEEKFYLLWPAVAFILLKQSNILRVLFILSCTGIYFFTSELWVVRFLWIHAYINILLGCLVAILLHTPEAYKRLSTIGRPKCTIAVALTLTFIQLFLFLMPDARWFFSLFVALLLIGLVTGQSGVDRFLSSRPLVYIGTRSYGIYLTHLLALNAVGLVFRPGQTNGWKAMVYVICSVAASLLVAEVLYQSIEKPCMKIGRKWSKSILSKRKETRASEAPVNGTFSPVAQEMQANVGDCGSASAAESNTG